MASDDDLPSGQLSDDELPDDMVVGWLSVDPRVRPEWCAQDRPRRAERAVAAQAVREDANWPAVLAAVNRYQELDRGGMYLEPDNGGPPTGNPPPPNRHSTRSSPQPSSCTPPAIAESQPSSPSGTRTCSRTSC